MNGLAALTPQSRCVLARGLLERWGPDPKQQPDWRTWSWPVARARQMVSSETEALRAMVADANGEICPRDDR